MKIGSRRNLVQSLSLAAVSMAICLSMAAEQVAGADHTVGARRGDEREARPSASAAAALASAAYFGAKLPEDKPELFAPGIVNLPGRSVGHLAFSPDATQCCFTVFESAYANNRILCTSHQNGGWSPQEALAIAKDRPSFEPLFSRDGAELYFGAPCPTGPPPNQDFWVAQHSVRGWTEPQPLGLLNSPKDEYALAQAADGTMYFASNRDGGLGGLDIYRAVARPGQPLRVENLGAPVNSSFNDGDPGISPDGRTLVFYSVPKRPGVTGGSDLFICFADEQGGWSEPVNMGEQFNTPVSDEYAATFSQDGRVLFFARFDGKLGQVYWVSAKALERFRKPPATKR